MLLFALLFVSTRSPASVLAQEESSEVSVPATEMHEFRATDGTDFDLFVALPKDYVADGSVEYPVFYTIDASQTFAALVQIYRFMEFSGELPPMILVGVDRAGVSWDEWWVARILDLTPTADPDAESQMSAAFGAEVTSGGADAYLGTLENEIIPWVEARYPQAPARGLGGFSLGGLFVVHALFSSPGTFTHYLVGSPSLFWDNRVAFDKEAGYSNEFDDLEAQVFMSAGSLEGTLLSDMLRMAEALEARGYDGLQLESQTLPDETHMSGAFLSMSRGLRFLFGTQ
jgi:predicted alpha/beta superfamily hydrolase